MDWVELITFIVKSFVRHPDSVVVSYHKERRDDVVVIDVDERDRGLLIGREGRNLKALERALRMETSPHKRGPTPRIELLG